MKRFNAILLGGVIGGLLWGLFGFFNQNTTKDTFSLFYYLAVNVIVNVILSAVISIYLEYALDRSMARGLYILAGMLAYGFIVPVIGHAVLGAFIIGTSKISKITTKVGQFADNMLSKLTEEI